MKVVVTGGAGFIGSNVIDALLGEGHDVIAIDNLSTGRPQFLEQAQSADAFQFANLDLYHQPESLADLFDGAAVVIHLAANADVRFGWNAPRRDVEQNVLATLNVLEAMRTADVPRIIFSSTGSVYGETPVIPTPEDAPFPIQTSLYGASKASAEGFVSAYAEAGFVSGTIFRFVSILGNRYTHGHVIDFVTQLRADATRLRVLGDGRQRKSYLDVSDCVAAILSQLGGDSGMSTFNLGCDEFCTVRDSVGWIAARLGLTPDVEYLGGERGWVGDNPFIFLDTSKIRETGWEPVHSIKQAVERTVDYLLDNPWLIDTHEPTR